MNYGAMINHETHERTVIQLPDDAKIGQHIDGAMIQCIFQNKADCWEYHLECAQEEYIRGGRQTSREIPSSDAACPL